MPTIQQPKSVMKTYSYDLNGNQVSKQFADDKAEREFRRANPYDPYSKAKEMKYLGDISNMKLGNQGISDLQMNDYNNLAKKWNYTPTTNFDVNKNNYNKSVSGANSSYEQSQAHQDASKWNNATIQDIASKYGFDYSRDYAKQQAEAEAQALRNANQDAQRKNESNKKTGLARIDSNLMNQAEAMDRNYFQEMLGQQQNQVNAGLNAGIASDQDLRLQMARQAEMGASHRDANLGRMQIDENFNLDDLRLTEGMGLINQQALAREDSLYNDRLQQGFGNLMTEREMANSLDQQQWGRSQADINRALQLYGMDNAQEQWGQEFQYGKDRDVIKDSQWQQGFDWDKIIDRANQTGLFEGKRNMDGQQFDWSKIVDQHGMTMEEKRLALQYAQMAQDARLASGGGGGGGGGSAGGTPASQLAKTYQNYNKEKSATPQNFDDRHYMGKLDQLDKTYDLIAKGTGQPKAQLPYSTSPLARSARDNILKAPTHYDRALDLFGLK